MRSRQAVGLVSLAAAVALLTAASTGPLPHPHPDEVAIRETVQLYFEGGEELNAAFHPAAHMYFVRDGRFAQMPIAEYISRSIASAASADASRAGAAAAVRKRIVEIDLTGSAAVAKLEIVRPEAVLTDYMSLLKVDGRWVIVHKIFDRAPVQRAAGR